MIMFLPSHLLFFKFSKAGSKKSRTTLICGTTAVGKGLLELKLRLSWVIHLTERSEEK